MENLENKLDLSGSLYVIKSNSSEIIPAMELDRIDNSYNILVFTSIENAKRYCHFRNPEGKDNIVRLSKKKLYEKWYPSGLLRIAYTAQKHYNKEIKHFVFDHPGTRGHAQYISVEDVLGLVKTKKNMEIKDKNELKDFLNNQE